MHIVLYFTVIIESSIQRIIKQVTNYQGLSCEEYCSKEDSLKGDELLILNFSHMLAYLRRMASLDHKVLTSHPVSLLSPALASCSVRSLRSIFQACQEMWCSCYKWIWRNYSWLLCVSSCLNWNCGMHFDLQITLLTPPSPRPCRKCWRFWPSSHPLTFTRMTIS